MIKRGGFKYYRSEYKGLMAIDMAPDNVGTVILWMFISSPNPLFDHLLGLSHWDNSNKWSNIGFGE